MFSKLSRLFHTIRYLRPVQVVYQVWYRVNKPLKLSGYGKRYVPRKLNIIKFSLVPPVEECWNGELQFTFLNQSVDFESEIDWNYQSNGKLWNYNLQYVNYLLQGDISSAKKRSAMEKLYQCLSNGDLALEPYPVSLRIVNMIRWLCEAEIHDPVLISKVYAEVDFLSRRLEYHLLGNHLLENAFALLMGSAFFGERKWEAKAKMLLVSELNEQVLADGAHFELSPMYHQIIFFRLLELIDWYGNYQGREHDFVVFCRNKASLMYAWMDKICFGNGDIPFFNDAANGVANGSDFLNSYASRLNIVPATVKPGSSGYRSYETGLYEIKVDAAQPGPSYQPGHAHADTLSFIMYAGGVPLFVEQGTSTYQINERRHLERSTGAHNTVSVNGLNQSDVWGGFRVGKRAKTVILKDEKNYLEASHDGYKSLGVIHSRSFSFSEERVDIVDSLSQKCSACFYLHLHPHRNLSILNSRSFCIDDNVKIIFSEEVHAEVEEYEYADSYNRYFKGKRLIVPFYERLETSILFSS